MTLDIKIPPVGESISEVTLSRWIKKDGDTLKWMKLLLSLNLTKQLSN